ncbi:MAG: hypothetical protein RL660_963 [Bacteroidota bacterium]|jgi:predicted DNA-binding transcriptional regulator YafY
MPANKDAYSRYKLIDARLRAKSKKAPTLQDLVSYVNDKLGKYVSERTIQTDIYNLRYDQNLGYNAPLAYNRKDKTYHYTQDNYSIEAIPLGAEDLVGLEMAIGILDQFASLPALKQFEELIQRLASTIKANRSQNTEYQSFIQLDRPQRYVGIEYLQAVVDCIRDQRVLRLQYHSFSSKQAKPHVVHPYLVKEYRGRLYLAAKDIAAGKMPRMLLFAFDRITAATETYEYFKPENIDREAYFKHTIGVGYSGDSPSEVHLAFQPTQAAYIKSQPLHASQKLLSDSQESLVISLKVVVNMELKMKILEFGSGVEVLQPTQLREWCASEAQLMAKRYGGG